MEGSSICICSKSSSPINKSSLARFLCPVVNSNCFGSQVRFIVHLAANYSMITAVNIDKSTSIGGVLTTFEEVVIMVVVVEEVVGAGGIITEQLPSSPRLKM
ncbi:hypothetical protein VPH35_000406 [Triticum aestivum]|uniref:Uncharacterized protein n=1 Tax=Triticum urartu TaxID=4572 RepID=A0A8R7TG08_TRIUA